MVFKAVANSWYDIETIWSSNRSHNVHRSKIINVEGLDKRYYKGRRLTYWENRFKPKEVRVTS